MLPAGVEPQKIRISSTSSIARGRSAHLERMRHDPRGVLARIGPVEPGDVALGELIRIARVGARRHRRVVEPDFRDETLMRRVGDDLVDRHQQSRKMARPTATAVAGGDGAGTAGPAGSAAPLALLVQVEPAAEERVHLLTRDGLDRARVRIVVLRVHGGVGGREIHPRGREARNGRSIRDCPADWSATPMQARSCAPGCRPCPSGRRPRPLPTSTNVVAVLCTGNRRKKTRTGEIVTDALDKIRTRATAKLKVGLPLLSAGRNSSSDVSSSCDKRVVEGVAVGDRARRVEVVDDGLDVANAVARVRRVRDAEHLMRLTGRRLEETQIVAEPDRKGLRVRRCRGSGSTDPRLARTRSAPSPSTVTLPTVKRRRQRHERRPGAELSAPNRLDSDGFDGKGDRVRIEEALQFLRSASGRQEGSAADRNC